MNPRYEWTAGPELIASHERVEFHAGKGVLEPKGEKFRLFVGQVRDRELGNLLNWAMRAPDNRTNARIAFADLTVLWPLAPDWSQTLKRGAAGQIPKGWTIPRAGSEFIQGLMI